MQHVCLQMLWTFKKAVTHSGEPSFPIKSAGMMSLSRESFPRGLHYASSLGEKEGLLEAEQGYVLFLEVLSSGVFKVPMPLFEKLSKV